MRLPWDKNYFKIAFYVAMAFSLCYLLKLLMDMSVGLLVRFGDVLQGTGSFLGGFFELFAPLVIGLVLAYILDPLVSFMQRHFDSFCRGKISSKLKKKLFRRVKEKRPIPSYKKRTVGTVLSFLFILAIIALFSVLVVQKMSGMGSIAEKISSVVNNFSDKYTALQIRMLNWGALDFISTYLAEFIGSVVAFVQNAGDRLVVGAASAGSSILRFMLGTVIAFYFSRDKERLLKKTNEYIKMLLPGKAHRMLCNALGDMHAVFSGYIRGQLIDACIMAGLISLLLGLIGIDFAIVIGIISGFSNMIPYFGAVTGFVLSVSVALISGESMKALYAAIGIIVLQQIDGLIIVPKVVGKNVELGPVPVLISLTVAGQLFGFGGLILAVPVCAILKICLNRLVERRKAAIAVHGHI